MALQRCPACRRKISDQLTQCIHCGFSLDTADLARYQQALAKHQQHNADINRKSVKLQLIWLGIFALVIALGVLWQHGG